MELAEAIRSDVVAGVDVPTTLRLVRQFIMDTDDRERFETVSRVAPPSTDDDRWDALICGVTEDLALRHGSSVPAWVRREPLDRWWFLTTVPRNEPTAFVETPPALAHRGVFVRRAALENV